MNHRIIGIDPGASGAVAVFWESGNTPVTVTGFGGDMSVLDILQDATIGHHTTKPNNGITLIPAYPVSIICYVEEVSGFCGKEQPGSRMFNFGRGFGYLLGVLEAWAIPVRLVRPQRWQAGLSDCQGVQGVERKRILKAHAARLFPALKVTLKTADALLIADYGRRMENQPKPATLQQQEINP